MSVEAESHDTQTPPSTSPQLAPETPVSQKTTLPHHAPTDSLVSVSLSESDDKSEDSVYSHETTPKDVVQEVMRRASCHTSPIEFMISDKVLDSPGADVRLVQELAMEKEKEKVRSRSNSMAPLDEVMKRERSDSTSSETSLQVDWETLDKTEQDQEEDSDAVSFWNSYNTFYSI
jgi:stalled ribosome rescue protein Dom34